jgi:Late embryogenesis abundant protein
MGARYSLVVLLALAGSSACAALGELRNLIQPPRFEEAEDRQAEIRLNRPGASQPLGGASVRLWTEVTNPNAFGLTLGTLRGTLHIEGSRAADVDFPLGLPLRPAEQTVIPIDLSISLADLAGLANAISRAVEGRSLQYRLEGTVGVDAGRLGQPVFGPMTLLSGEMRGIRSESDSDPSLSSEAVLFSRTLSR